MTFTKKQFVACVIFVWSLLLIAQSAIAGTITITKCKMTDKTNSTEVTSGYADATLSVDFTGEANCNCEGPSLTYTWYFGDGDSATGATASHAYSGSKAGNRSPYLNVHCDTCDADKNSSSLSVNAISGINVTTVGNNGKLCFDDVRNVAASALPAGVSGSDKIDWYLVVTSPGVSLANSSSGTLPSPNPWPTSNSLWGSNTLYVSIDGPHVAGQQGELNLTGTVSYVSNNQSVTVFFDETGTQNPNGSQPNWFYYWTQTSANAGTMHYDPNSSLGYSGYDAPNYTCYLGTDNHGSYTTPSVGANANTTLSGIDHFAWTARHEWRHHANKVSWWGTGGYDANRDTDGDKIPDSNPDSESTFGSNEGGPYTVGDPDTFAGDGLNNDNERYTVFTQAVWSVGSANSEDWAHPGKQWQ